MKRTRARRWIGAGGVALGLFLGSTVSGALTARVAAAAESTDGQQLAHFKVEIKQETGQVAKNAVDMAWNEEQAVVFKAADHTHTLAVKIERANPKSSKLSVTIAYERDGQPVVAPYTYDTRVKRREILRIEGGLAMALTVTPSAKPTENAPGNPNKIELEDGNDPLAGL